MYSITQEQYDDFITKMNKNQSGTCFILLGRNMKKLYKDDGGKIYWTAGRKKIRYYFVVNPKKDEL